VAQRKHTSKDHYARELDRRRSEEVCHFLPWAWAASCGHRGPSQPRP